MTPKAPKPPDPAVQANAEAAANRYNVIGPSGSQQWLQGEPTIIGYDSKGFPQWGTTNTQQITLGDSEQRQLDTRNQIAEGLLGGASEQIPEFMSDPFSYDNQGSKAADAVYERQRARLEPDFKKATTAFEDRMANAGLPVGSEAYNDAFSQLNQDQEFALSDAAMGAEQVGSQLALSERQQRYNELAAAMDSQQLQPVNAFGTGGAPIDVSGAYANQQAGRNAQYQASAQNANQTNQALAMAAMYVMSDEELKYDVEQIEEMPTGEGVYEYRYNWEDENDPKHVGVMAQEVEENYPEAVATHPSGYKMVNYRLIAEALAA